MFRLSTQNSVEVMPNAALGVSCVKVARANERLRLLVGLSRGPSLFAEQYLHSDSLVATAGA